ncbi:MAG: carbon-nitrogen hydrolase family protein [Chloroflexia bacterium]
MGRTLGIAAVQTSVVDWDAERTLQRMERELGRIRQTYPWVKLVCFPELFPTGVAPRVPPPEGRRWDWNAETIPGPITERLAEMARRYGLWLQPGSLHEREDDTVYNTALVFSPDGELVARYRKMFPWRPWEAVAAGRDFCTFDIPGVGRFGLCICYDTWFPELVRTLVWLGAEVILHPSLSYTQDRRAELVLEQSHALFNQCYLVSVNAAAPTACGRSLIVDPHGRVLHEAGADEELLVEVIDLELVQRVRELGTLGLNQHLKQLRDFPGQFPAYAEGIARGPGFAGLGPLHLPRSPE